MNTAIRTIVFWIVIVVSAFLLWTVVRSGNSTQTPSADEPEISYSEFLNRVDGGSVAKVTIGHSELRGVGRDNSRFRVNLPDQKDELVKTLRQKNVEIWFRPGTPESTGTWVMNFAPVLLIAALWFFIFRQTRQRQVQNSQPGPTIPPSAGGWNQR